MSIVSSHEWLSVTAGSTALHFAAAVNGIEYGVLLVEAGADMRTSNNNSKSPLDLASHDFRRAIQQAQSFSTKRIVAVIGNAEHGKSTLIAALQAEGNSLLKKLTNRFTKCRTSGREQQESKLSSSPVKSMAKHCFMTLPVSPITTALISPSWR